MKSIQKVLSLAGVAIVVSSVSFAADLPAPVIEHVPEVPVATGGWYLRGDIGYKIYQDPDVGFGGQNFTNESMDDTAVIGVGVGYKFNDYFRSDLTVDYEFASEFNSRTVCGGCVGGISYDSADISVWTVLLNAYVDLGTWNNFTPYVGGGVGASYITVGGVTSDVGTGVVQYGGDQTWQFSWALMAGASYAFNPNLSLDAGYRYLNIGDARSDILTTGGVTDRVRYDDLQAHEFRVGLRYTFDSAPAYIPAEPIYSKF